MAFTILRRLRLRPQSITTRRPPRKAVAAIEHPGNTGDQAPHDNERDVQNPDLPSETPRFASLDEAVEAAAGIRRAVGQDPGTALGAITLFRPQARELLQS
jgi:hypothetical protein